MTLADLATRLNLRAAGRRRLPPLILMTDERRLADPVAAVRALPAGAAVILRHYGTPDRGDLARHLLAACRPLGVRLLVAGDAALAAAIGADGLHLPEDLVATLAGRLAMEIANRRSGWIVTVAAHSPVGLLRAARAGADAALLSPVFATASHPGRAAIGALNFAAMCRAAPLAVYALGGVSAANARRLVASGAVGIAGISGIAAAIEKRPL